MATKYVVLSLPLDVFESSDKNEAIASLKSTLADHGTVLPYASPSFKIGTLDTLVQQADDLTKMESACAAVVSKVADSLKMLLGGDESKVAQHKKVNEKTTDQYISGFSWNRGIYRPEKPLSELVDMLQKEVTSIDGDIKTKLNQYSSVRTNLASLERQRNGNLSVKSLSSVVDPSLLIRDSEYLESHLIAVPKLAKKDFLRTYETLAPMVVPRSAVQLSQDDEFVLFTVVTFKKVAPEFLQKCREHKWIPRHYTHVEGGMEQESRELDRMAEEEKRAWAEAMRMAVMGWGMCVQIWLHIIVLRGFVESVLRYGLPLDYVTCIIKTTAKACKKVKAVLDANYSYLGGNALNRDKRGNVADDSALASEMAAAGLGSGSSEYTAYVYYEVEIP